MNPLKFPFQNYTYITVSQNSNYSNKTNKQKNFLSSSKFGLLIMLVACLLFSIMNTSVYAIKYLDSSIPSFVISFFRIFINFLILVIPALFRRNFMALFGDCSTSLWLRGLFGTAALMLSFASITRIGPGESAFLGASSGVFVALLSPWLLKQKNSVWTWGAILGSFIGVALLCKTNSNHYDLLGQAMALGSGFLAALAYIMVAHAGRRNSAQTVVFYFCLVALLLHSGYFVFYGYSLPNTVEIWELLLFTGLIGSGAQYTMTLAYQAAPATLVSAVGYLSPVLSLVWGVIFFAQTPNIWGFVGSAMILLSGVLLPFLQTNTKKSDNA
jgi:S-adenosylmethionine uptake transporter